jgi:hypothetical protein
MTSKTFTLLARPRTGIDFQPLLVGLAVLLVCVIAARMLTVPSELRFVVVGVAVALVVGLSAISQLRLLYGLIVWLAALGVLRRALDVISPNLHADPLLLVGPFAVAILFVAAAKRGAFNNRSRLASAVLALNVLTTLGALNPLQGSFATGLAGLLFVLVPTLAFWVGRGLCDDRAIATVLKLFAIISIPAAVYGLEQTFAGFPSWDAAWISAHATDYASITVQGVPRAFASFSAASEYVTFLAIGLIVWVAFGLRPVLAPIAVGAIGMLSVAIFYEGSRGVVIGSLVAFAMMAGARAGVRLKWSVVMVGVLILVLPYAVTHLVRDGPVGGYSSPLVARQVAGLQNPGDPTVSTLHAHIKLVTDGVHSARHEPVGRGTGAVTIAGLKFGGGYSGTEADPSNAAVAWGIPGLIVYVVILFEAIRRAYRLASLRRGWLAPAALAIIVVTALEWLNGGQYAVAFLPWLLLGWIDRSLSPSSRSAREPV